MTRKDDKGILQKIYSFANSIWLKDIEILGNNFVYIVEKKIIVKNFNNIYGINFPQLAPLDCDIMFDCDFDFWVMKTIKDFKILVVSQSFTKDSKLFENGSIALINSNINFSNIQIYFYTNTNTYNVLCFDYFGLGGEKITINKEDNCSLNIKGAYKCNLFKNNTFNLKSSDTGFDSCGSIYRNKVNGATNKYILSSSAQTYNATYGIPTSGGDYPNAGFNT